MTSPLSIRARVRAMIFPIVTACALVAQTTSAHAASAIAVTTNGDAAVAPAVMRESVMRESAMLQSATLKPVDLLALRRPNGPTAAALLTCEPGQSETVCHVRKAAVRRALEVVTEEKVISTSMPLGAVAPLLLIPDRPAVQGSIAQAGEVPSLIQVRAVACDPALSTEECAKLEKRIPSTPSSPLPPNVQAPSPVNPQP